jgi:hypothetical protein
MIIYNSRHQPGSNMESTSLVIVLRTRMVVQDGISDVRHQKCLHLRSSGAYPGISTAIWNNIVSHTCRASRGFRISFSRHTTPSGLIGHSIPTLSKFLPLTFRALGWWKLTEPRRLFLPRSAYASRDCEIPRIFAFTFVKKQFFSQTQTTIRKRRTTPLVFFVPEYFLPSRR